MSLETQIQTLTDAINNLAFIIKQQAILQNQGAADEILSSFVADDKVASLVAAQKTASPAPAVTIVPEPEPKPIPIVEAVLVAAPVQAAASMPAPPFMVAARKAPFTDTKGLKEYLTASWQALGPVEGMKIERVMMELGHSNINDIKPDRFDALFSGVEALK